MRTFVAFEVAGIQRGFTVSPDAQRFVMAVDVEQQPVHRELVLVKNWAEELKRLVPVRGDE